MTATQVVSSGSESAHMFRGVPVGEGALGGEPVRVWGFDAGGGEHLSDDLAPVGGVRVLPDHRRLTGTLRPPRPRFSRLCAGRHPCRDQARAGVFGGDAVPQPDLDGAGSFRVHRSRAASGSHEALRCGWSM